MLLQTFDRCDKIRLPHELNFLSSYGENYLGKRCFPLFPYGDLGSCGNDLRINTFSAHPSGCAFFMGESI